MSMSLKEMRKKRICWECYQPGATVDGRECYHPNCKKPSIFANCDNTPTPTNHNEDDRRRAFGMCGYLPEELD